MPRCPRCDRTNDEESRFCKHCGYPMAGADGSSEVNDDTLIIRLLDERPEESITRRARIWVLDPSGERVAQAAELKEETTAIGRNPDCAISLPSSTVSRRHARIRKEGNQFLLSDLNSTNGTILNREPVIGEELLHDRDEIGVGIYRLIFRYS
jgi:pSer/pThr/pTyr-binding forkhead associated (FHA) protein